MIAKAKSCVGGTALIGYVVNQKKGHELERNNLSGEKASELYRSMRVIQNQNLRCKNNTISVVLSPEKSDGKVMTNEQWRGLTTRFLSALGINKTEAQYISFIHTEKEHRHVHIILNRVNDDGSLIKDHFIGKRAQHIAHRVAKEMNLKSAREIKEQKEKDAKTVLKQFREEFCTAHELVKSQYPKSLQAYRDLMSGHNFEIQPFVNKQGLLQGFKVKKADEDETVKLSQIDRKIKLDDNFFNELAIQKQHTTADAGIEKELFNQEKQNYRLRR